MVHYWNEKAETMPRDELEKLQGQKLRKLAEYVNENVEFYNKKFKEMDISPADIKSIEDITKLPLTWKTDLRDHYPFGLNAVAMDNIIRIHASSGTTGKPTVVSYTKKDIDDWTELMARTVVAPGITKSDVVQNAYGYGLFTGGLGFHYGAEKVGCSVIPISGGNTERQLMIMQDFESTVLTCTPSYALYIAEYAKNEGIDVEKLALKKAICGAEPWSDNLRKQIEKILHIDAYDIYGLSEIYGPGVSVECEEKNGMHIWEDFFIVEVLDKKTWEPVSEGEEGVLAFTTLEKTGIPLIRYITYDIATFTKEKCACGRTCGRMSKVTGRADDMLIVRGINVFPSQIEHVLSSIPGVAGYYQIIIDRDIIDSLEVQVELTPDTFSDEMKVLEKFKKQIELKLYNTLQVRADVELVSPGTLPRTEGKAKHVIDKRTKNI
ncbi:MAG: AMP-binding protein [Candidatus Lokiarchaeota archaeon]|nr:AMP-binding protein [Candidatus Lokiarchaeota archaeon]MBD3342786.1 AMP-binding protein [Candidatus Lokiarchaeota archaeon]